MDLDKEQIKELVTFLNDKNPVVKVEALGIILQYSAKTEHRKLFEGTDLMKLVLRLHSDEVFLC